MTCGTIGAGDVCKKAAAGVQIGCLRCYTDNAATTTKVTDSRYEYGWSQWPGPVQNLCIWTQLLARTS